MRNGADRTTGAAMGVGLGAVAVAGEGLEHAGNITASILRSDMCWFCKFLMMLAMPLFFYLLIATFKMGNAGVQVLIIFGGTFGWATFVLLLDRFGKYISKQEDVFEVATEVEKYNIRNGTNFGCDENNCYFDKSNPHALRVSMFEPSGFDKFLRCVENHKKVTQSTGNHAKDSIKNDIDDTDSVVDNSGCVKGRLESVSNDMNATKTCPGCGTVCSVQAKTCRICPRSF